MCGIVGIYSRTNPVDSEIIHDMCSSISHRGPDDEGTYVAGNIGLGMRRLSIIDLSSGMQPISNESDSITIVFNGEIYNYQELRKDLQNRGHIFKTNSDTETILHAYEEFGLQAPTKLQGMFSFAIWDRESESLYLARDRFGIKPLFYSWDGSNLVFASEIKALLRHSNISSQLDTKAVSDFFSFMYVPGSRTLLEDVSEIPPGHFLKVSKNKFQLEKYYSLPQKSSYRKLTDKDALDQLLTLSKDVVQSHMISDVPLGSYLSGGIDSGIITALMSEISSKRVQTFSIGYDELASSYDERIYARLASQHLGTDHYELLVSPSDIADILPNVLSRLDVPFGNASVIPNLLLSEFVSQHVTVALSGLGGDEIAAGYERYRGTLLLEKHPLLQSLIGSEFTQSIVNFIPDSKKGSHYQERLKRLAASAHLPLQKRYLEISCKWSDAERSKLFSPDFLSQISQNRTQQVFQSIWDRFPNLSTLQKLLAFDIQTYLVDDLLALSDRTSMANSIELRVPFLDHRIVEFFWNIEDKQKLRGKTKKYLLQKAALKLLPRAVVLRPKKGFSVPLPTWFRGPLRAYLEDNLSEKSLKELEIFSVPYVRALIEEHVSGRRNHDDRLFALLSFAIWRNSLK